MEPLKKRTPPFKGILFTEPLIETLVKEALNTGALIIIMGFWGGFPSMIIV